MSFFAGADDLGDGSIWDSGLDIFGQSKISKLLEGGSFSLEELLGEDEFIQEAQSQSKQLLDFLTSPPGLHSLVRYIAVPQRTGDEARAFRFPYMATEAICCNVPALLDALTHRGQAGTDHLTLLFSVASPALRERAGLGSRYRPDTSGDQPLGPGKADPFLAQQGHGQAQDGSDGYEVRPYLAGYAAKVVALLCRARPAAMIRFLDRTPGIAAALVSQLHCGSIASLLRSLLALPWACDGALGMSSFRLSRADPVPLLDLLLGVMRAPVEASAAGTATAKQAMAAEHACDVLLHALHVAVCAPHVKFEAEGYNAARLAAVRAGPGGGGNSGSGSAALPSLPGQEGGDGSSAVDVDAVLSHTNLTLDPTFHEAGQRQGDSLPLRLLKELRDGEGGAAKLAALVDAAVGLMASAAQEGRQLSTNAQTACEAPLRLLHAVLRLCGVSYRHQAVLGEGGGQVSPCPGLLSLLLQGGGLQRAILALDALSGAANGAVQAALSTHPEPERRTPVNVGIRMMGPAGKAPVAAAAPGQGAAKAPPVGGDVETGVAPPPSYSQAPRLGTAGLALARCLCAVLRCSWPEVEAALPTSGLGPVLLQTLSSFPWHSIMHKGVTDTLVDCLHEGSPAVKRHLLVDGRLLTTLVAGCRLALMPPRLADLGASRKARVGYSGHLAAVATAVLGSHARGTLPTTTVAPMLPSHSDWWALVDRELAVAGVAHGVLIGGLAPDVKASGNVGNSADATGGPAKVDEVPMGRDGEDEDGQGSIGSDEGHDEEEQGEEEEGDGMPLAGHGHRRSDEQGSGSGRGGVRDEAHYLAQAAAAGPEDEEEEGDGRLGDGGSSGGSSGEEGDEREQQAAGSGTGSGAAGSGNAATTFASLDEEEEEEGSGGFAALSGDGGGAGSGDGFAPWGEDVRAGSATATSSAPAASSAVFGFGVEAGGGADVDFAAAAFPSAPLSAGAGQGQGQPEEDDGFGFPSSSAPAPVGTNGEDGFGFPSSSAPAPAGSHDEDGFGFDADFTAPAGAATTGTTAAASAPDEFGFGEDAFGQAPAAVQPSTITSSGGSGGAVGESWDEWGSPTAGGAAAGAGGGHGQLGQTEEDGEGDGDTAGTGQLTSDSRTLQSSPGSASGEGEGSLGSAGPGQLEAEEEGGAGPVSGGGAGGAADEWKDVTAFPTPAAGPQAAPQAAPADDDDPFAAAGMGWGSSAGAPFPAPAAGGGADASEWNF